MSILGLVKAMVHVIALLFLGCLLLVGIGAVLVGSNTPSERQLTQTKATGNAIVVALDRFAASNGSYPDSLEELTPQYLKEVHPPAFWERWRYSRRDKKASHEFSLGCSGYNGFTSTSLDFSSPDREWKYDSREG